MTRVLIGVPTSDAKRAMTDALLAGINALDTAEVETDLLIADNSETEKYAEELRAKGIQVMRTPAHANPYDRLIAARNALRQHCLEQQYDYYFSLESDVIPEPATLKRLLSWEKPYVTTIMFNWEPPREEPVMIVWREKDGRFVRLTKEDIDEGDLITIARSHLGCTLISKEALVIVPFRHDDHQFDDYLFCDDLRAHDVELFCDTTLSIEHRPDGTMQKISRDWRNAYDKQYWKQHGKLPDYYEKNEKKK